MSRHFERSDITLANWRAAPYSSWSFQHVEELVPVAIVAGGVSLPHAAGPGPLDALAIDDAALGKTALNRYLEDTRTDSLVVMREGTVLGEWHAPHADRACPHVIFSISKSLTGMLVGIAVGEGGLDPESPVSHHVDIAEEGRAYAGARVRDLLDMTVDLDFDEAYTDEGGVFDRYRRAMLWNPERPGTKPGTMEAFLASLGTVEGGRHGKRFQYASPNTDMLGLVIERATGTRYHDYLASRLWAPMGAGGAARVTLDRVGTARAAGGICVTPHDLALLGQLVLDGGRAADGTQVIPAAWIEDTLNNGDREAWVTGNFADMFRNGRYRSCWYSSGDDHGSFCGVGIHGQWLWVDPETRIVVAKTSSQPEASDDSTTGREIAALGQICRRLG